MVSRAAVSLLVGLVVLSGCTTPFFAARGGLSEWLPLPCDPTQQSERNQLTQKDPSPSGDMTELAVRFGSALGDPVQNRKPTVNAEGRSEWTTEHGIIRSRHPIDVQTLLEYEARRTWPGLDAAAGRASLETFADRFGFRGERIINYTSKDSTQFDGRVHQSVEGRPVGTSPTQITYVEREQEAAYVRVTLRPFWVLPSAERRVDEARALEIGHAFMRCQLDQHNRTQVRGYEHRYTGLLFDWLSVHNKTLAYVVTSKFHNPMGGACPSEKSEGTMYVDAWTGTVLTWEWNRCSRPTNTTAGP